MCVAVEPVFLNLGPGSATYFLCDLELMSKNKWEKMRLKKQAGLIQCFVDPIMECGLYSTCNGTALKRIKQHCDKVTTSYLFFLVFTFWLFLME